MAFLQMPTRVFSTCFVLAMVDFQWEGEVAVSRAFCTLSCSLTCNSSLTMSNYLQKTIHLLSDMVSLAFSLSSKRPFLIEQKWFSLQKCSQTILICLFDDQSCFAFSLALSRSVFFLSLTLFLTLTPELRAAMTCGRPNCPLTESLPFLPLFLLLSIGSNMNCPLWMLDISQSTNSCSLDPFELSLRVYWGWSSRIMLVFLWFDS